MSRTVDERVVSMQFDNKQFENNVQTSLSTLDKLKQSLNLTGAAKGFENIDSAAKNLNFSNLTGAVDTVKERFSALEVMAVTALANITNSIVNTGKQMLNSLAVEPVKQGFEEYELKLDSVQTIMASTGESIETVNGYLQELNTYADKTIYSFSDMTSSIGKFTNSGVKLEDAVKAIQGISNEAAVSGANAQQASHAMYNFAQALSSGSVKLIDWKSIENANMATVEFKNELIKTAVELGTVVKEEGKFVSTTEDANGNVSDAFDATSMFNDSLSSNWMTSEVLVKTLAKYSDETSELGKKAFAAAQDVKTFTQLMDTLKEAVGSGWATTWEIIFGDFEEAKKLWTAVSNVVGGFIDSQSDARNALLQEWKDLGGRMALIDAFKNAFGNLKKIIEPVRQAFVNMIPPITGKKLTEISKKIQSFTADFKMSYRLTRNIRYTFTDLLIAVKNVFESFRNVATQVKNAFVEIFGATNVTGEGFRSVSRIIRKLSLNFQMSEETSQNLKNTFKGLFAVIDILKEAVMALIRNFTRMSYDFSQFPSKILSITGALGEWFVWLDNVIKENDIFNKSIQTVINFITNLSTIFKGLIEILKEKLHIPSISDITAAFAGLVRYLSKFDKNQGIQNANKVLGKIAEHTSKVGNAAEKASSTVRKSVEEVAEAFSNNPIIKMLGTLWTAVKKVGSAIINVFGNVIKNIGDKLSHMSGNELLLLLNSLTSVATGAALSKFVKTLGGPLEKLSGLFESVSGIADNIGEVLDQVGKSLKAYQTQLKAGALKQIAIAIGIIAVSILVLSSIDEKALKSAVSAMTMMFLELMGSMAVLSKMSGGMKNVEKSIGVMLAMSFSILILASALKKIAKLDPKELVIGLAGLGVTMAMLIAAVKELSKNSNTVMKGAGQLILLAIALRIMASALNSFAKLNMEQTLTGLVGLGGSLLLISLILRDMPERSDIAKLGFGLIEVSAALWIMSKALVSIGNMDTESLGKGLLGIFVGLYSISMALQNMPRNMASTGFGLILVSVGLLIIAQSIKQLGSLDAESLGKGLLGLFVGLNSISMALQNMHMGVAKKAAGLVVLSVSLLLIAEVIKELGSLDFFTLGKGLVGMSISLLAISMAMRNMPPVKRLTAASAAIVAVSKALEFIAKAVKEIGSMNLQDVAEGLLAIVVTLAAITVAIRDMPDEKKTAASTAAIVAIAKVLEPMAKAIKEIGSMSLQDIAEGVLGIVVALFSVAVAVRYMPDPKKTAASVAGFVAVIGTFKNIASAMKEIGSLKWDEFVRGMVGLNATIIALVIALEVMQSPKVLLGAAALVIASTAIAIFAPALQMLGSMGWEGICVGLVGIAGAFTILGVAAKILGKLAPQILSMSFSIASLGISIGVGLAGIAAGIAAFGLGIAGLGVGLVVAGLGLQEFSIGFTAFCGALLVGTTEIIAALGILVASMDDIILPLIDKLVVIIKKLIKALLEIIVDCLPDIREMIKVAVEMIFGVIVDVLKDSVQFIGDIVVIALDLIVKILEGLVEKLPQIVDLLLVLLIQIIDGLTEKLPQLVRSLVDFIMVLFSSVFDALADVDPEIFQKVLIGIGEIAAIIAAMSWIAPMIPTALSGVLGMAAFVAELSAVLVAFGAIAEIPGLIWIIGEGGKLLEALGNAIGKFVGGIVGGILEGTTSSFPEIGNDLSDFMDNLKPFVEGAKNIDADSMNGVKALADVVLTLTAANILDGLTAWFTGGTSLVKFGEELAEFGPYFKQYSDSVGDNINADVIQASATAAKALCEMANNLPKQGGALQWWTGEGDLKKFADELKEFGPSLVEYADSVEGLNGNVVENSANAAKALFEMAENLPKHGGFKGWFNGDNDLPKFAHELAVFGPSLMEYALSVEGLKKEVVENSVSAASVLSEFAENLPKHGGMDEWFTGTNKLSDFAVELVKFGPSLMAYDLSVRGLKPDVVINSANAAKALSELANNLPSVGGMASWFSGEKNMTVFGEQLPEFGKGLKKYSDKIKGLKPEVVANSANAAEALVALSNKLDNQGGIFSWFTGDKNLSVFGERLISFGEDFASYSKKMEDVKPDIVNKTTSAAESIVELQKKFTEADSGGWWSNNKNLTDFGSDMKTFGENFKGYYDKVKEIKADHLAKVIEQVNAIIQIAIGTQSLNMDGMKKFSKDLGSIGESGINAFMKAFTDAKSQIEKTAQNMIDYFIDVAIKSSQTFEATFTNLTQDALNGMESKMSDFDTKGSKAVSEFIDGALSKNNDLVKSSQQLMNGFINGIGNRQNAVKDQMITVIIFAISSVKSKYNDFYDVGVYFVDGFILGLKANISKVEEAAKTIANAAKTAVEKTLDEHSPSKVGYEIGDFFGAGFVNGIYSYVDKSYLAGENIAYSAKNGLQSALSKIADSVNGEIDVQPTIRPVVDLSNVRKSADSISNLLNADRSVYLARSTGMSVNMSKANIQNEVHINNDGVIREMNNLRKDISQLSDTVGKMKIVMDTGELVGAIANPIDIALGRQAIYSKRGN